MFQFLKSSLTSVYEYTFGRNRKRKAVEEMSYSDGLPNAKKALLKEQSVQETGSQVEEPPIDLTGDAKSFPYSDLNSSSFVKRTLFNDSNVCHRMRPIIKYSRRSGSFSSKNSNESLHNGSSQALYTSWCRNNQNDYNGIDVNGETDDVAKRYSAPRTRSSRRSMPHPGFYYTPKLGSKNHDDNSRIPSFATKSTIPYVKPLNGGFSSSDRKMKNSRSINDVASRQFSEDHATGSEISKEDDDDLVVTRVEFGQTSFAPKSADFEKLISQCRYVTTDWLAASKANSKNIVEENFRKADALQTLVKECEQKRSVWDSYLSKRTLRYLRLTSYEPTPIPDIYLEPEISEEEEELPPVTKEMRARVETALRGRRDAILCDNFRLQVTVSELVTLKPRQWLSDMIINFYMQLIAERNSKKEGALTCHPMTTFFYPKLRQSGYAGVRRWTRKIDIFGFDLVLAPIHLGQHWCFTLIQIKEKKISYFDSMQSPNNECLSQLLQYLIDEMKDKKGEVLDVSSWSVENAKNIPVQRNGYDCGVFTCQFAEYLSRRAPLNFSQDDMGYFRERMMYEIVSMKLLT